MPMSQPRYVRSFPAVMSPRTLNSIMPGSRRAGSQRTMRIGGRSSGRLVIGIVRRSRERPADCQELLPPLPSHGLAVEPLEFVERVGDRFRGRGDCGLRIAMG